MVTDPDFLSRHFYYTLRAVEPVTQRTWNEHYTTVLPYRSVVRIYSNRII